VKTRTQVANVSLPCPHSGAANAGTKRAQRPHSTIRRPQGCERPCCEADNSASFRRLRRRSADKVKTRLPLGSASSPLLPRSATACGDAFARGDGSDLLTLRLRSVDMPAVRFVASPTFWKVSSPCPAGPPRPGFPLCHAVGHGFRRSFSDPLRCLRARAGTR